MRTGRSATDGIWLDLLSPTASEIAEVEKTAGVSLPSLGALSEIESSRLLYMSTPSTARHPEGTEVTPPVGFILSEDRLITVPFMPLPSFDAVAAKFKNQDGPKSGLEVFAQLCEEAVDRGRRAPSSAPSARALFGEVLRYPAGQ
jgi:magnesium transporter